MWIRCPHAFLYGIVVSGLVSGLSTTAMGRIVNPSTHRQVNEAFRLLDSDVITLTVADTPGTPLSVVVPIAGHQYTLNLEPRSIRSPGFTVQHQIEGGGLVPVDPGPVRTLRGTAVEDATVRVAGSLLPDGLHVKVRIPGVGTHWLEPIAGVVPGAPDDAYVVYRAEDVVPSNGLCGTDPGAPIDVQPALAPRLADEYVARDSGGDKDGGGGIAGADLPGLECFFITQLALDADFPYFEEWGTLTENRMEFIIDLVNDQYETQTGIRHEIVAMIVRTSEAADPYDPPNNNSGALLGQFRQEWLSNQGGIERDVAHLFTGRELEGSVIGQAFTIGGICTNEAYCISQSDCCNPNTPCATDLTAHELGHLWGGFHCTCPGFTMNPSITCANVFTPGTVSSIVSHRDSRTCLDDVCAYVNDACGNLLPISAGDFEFATIGAATDGFPETLCDFGDGDDQVGSDLWYLFVSNCAGTATVSLCDADYDSKIAVYLASGVGCPSGPDTAIACADGGCGQQASVSFATGDFTFYYLRIGGAGSAEGSGTMSVELICGEPCPTDLNGDGETDVQDLTAVILAWDTADAVADINGDGTVDVLDLTELILGWGRCQ